MIQIKELSFRYNKTLPWVLQDIQLQLPQQGILGLVGHNGAGKSTLMSIIAGLYSFESGVILSSDGQVLSSNALIQQVSLVPQGYAFYQELTVLQNLELFYQIAKKNNLATRLDQVIDLCDLSGFLKQQASKISGGQRRRLNLAICLIKDAKILLLDEPTVGIDPQSKRDLLNTIKSLADGGKSILYTSHILSEVEQICDEICILQLGQLKLRPIALDQMATGQQCLFKVKNASNKKTLDSLLDGYSTQWVNADTMLISVPSISDYTSLLQEFNSADITIQSTGFGQNSLEQLYF